MHLAAAIGKRYIVDKVIRNIDKLITFILSIGILGISFALGAFSSPRSDYRPISNLSLTYPTAVRAPITSGYGYRWSSSCSCYKLHEAVDIGVGVLTPLVASIPGKLYFGRDICGKYITIENGDYKVGYWHITSSRFVSGAVVSAGDIIGLSGADGGVAHCVNGAHLHFWLSIKGRSVDPTQYFK